MIHRQGPGGDFLNVEEGVQPSRMDPTPFHVGGESSAARYLNQAELFSASEGGRATKIWKLY